MGMVAFLNEFIIKFMTLMISGYVLDKFEILGTKEERRNRGH